MEETKEGAVWAEEPGTSCWNQELRELGSAQVEEASRQVRFKDDLKNPMDADEHDVGPNPPEVTGLIETKSQSR